MKVATRRHFYGKAKIDAAFKEHLSTVLNWTVDQYYQDMFNTVGELFEADREAVLEIIEGNDRVGTAAIEKVDAYITEKSIPRWADDTFPWLWSVFRDVNEVWYNFFGVVNEKQIGGYEENLLSRGVLKFAEAVGETNRARLRNLLNAAMKEGWDQEKTARVINGLFDKWVKNQDLPDEEAEEWVEERRPRYRREMIARTELIRASNNAALMRFQSQGIRYKEWHVTDDDRLCFPAGTLVETALGPVEIESLNPGDMVLTRNGPRPVKQVHRRPYRGTLVTVEAEGYRVTSTSGHPFWVEGKGWVKARELSPGDVLKTVGNHLVNVEAVKFAFADVNNAPSPPLESHAVYNLEVEDTPEYYANGILVHNCPFCAKMDGKKLTLVEPFARVGDTVPGGDGEDAPTFKVDYMDVMAPPLHPHCRCTVLPWHPDWDDSPPIDLPDPDALQPSAPAELEDLEQPDIFPDDLPSRVQHVRDLGGSTGAALVEDPKTGRKYVRKYGDSADHIRSEALTNRLYRALGVRVPPLRLYEGGPGDRPAMYSKYIEDARTLKEVLQEGGKEAQDAIWKLREGFTADALLGNHDVLGDNYDNVLVDPSGKVWRIDNGGGLRYQGRGEKKAVFDEHPLEFWSLRNPLSNRQAGKVFGEYADLQMIDIVRQIEELNTPAFNTVLNEVEGGVVDTIRGRLREAERMADYGRKMYYDGFNWSYLNEFLRSDQLVRRNLVDKFPDMLESESRRVPYILRDENGERFDNLRGRDSIMVDFFDLVRKQGGKPNYITGWANDQATSSWNPYSQALKFWIAKNRRTPLEDYFWGPSNTSSLESARRAYEDIENKDAYNRSMSLLHALNFEFLSNVDMPNNSPENDFVSVVRTVGKSYIDMFDLREGGFGKASYAAYSSTSIVSSVTVGGSQGLIFDVPHWRIMGNYIFSRDEYDNTFFYGDRENELVAILDGLEFYYHGYVRSGTLLTDLM